MPAIDLSKVVQQSEQQAQVKINNVINLSTQLLLQAYPRLLEPDANMSHGELVDLSFDTALRHFEKIEKYIKEEKERFKNGSNTIKTT